jgi:cysteinyl-tRNA synthetase
VYFSPDAVADYGLLARQSIDSLRAGARVEVVEEKRSPIDFALWKLSKPGEPSWPSPWGAGRPGWHTECVVMSLDLLGEGFDLHGGGQDLAFPHHENERAQAVAAGRAFARHWMHNGFVEVAGEKMSKSLGNFTDLLDLVADTDHRAYRLLVLRSHYRSPVEVTRATTADASKALEGLDAFARRCGPLLGVTPVAADAAADAAVAGAGAVVEPDGAVLDAFRARMDDDLDTPGAVALLFTTVTAANRALDAGDEPAAAALAASVAAMVRAVGLDLAWEADVAPDDVVALADERAAARSAKDWARADELRDELAARGWLVEDTPTGPVVRRS